MFQQLQFWYADTTFMVSNFYDMGGSVLIPITVVIFVMWILIVERMQFFYLRFPGKATAVQQLWEARSDHHSWQAHQIRHALIAELRQQTHAYIRAVKALVAICPLLGLLGTVTGMILVFNVMSTVGMGNPRLMADGVAKATIPTMAGMIGALPGIFAMYWLDWQAKTRIQLLEDRLLTEHQAR